MLHLENFFEKSFALLLTTPINFEKQIYQFTYLHIDDIIKRQTLFFENGGSFNENLFYQGL